MIRLMVVLFFLNVAIGCRTKGEEVGKVGNLVYFDIKGFFENEKERIKEKTSFSKTVKVNGKTEEKKAQQIDFENDIDIFIKADINRPAWSDKYQIDSTFNIDNELVKLSYYSKDSSLLTKSIAIDIVDGKVQGIFIESSTKSNIADTRQTLRYIPENGYSIKSYQDVATIKPKSFEVEIAFE